MAPAYHNYRGVAPPRSTRRYHARWNSSSQSRFAIRYSRVSASTDEGGTHSGHRSRYGDHSSPKSPQSKMPPCGQWVGRVRPTDQVPLTSEAASSLMARPYHRNEWARRESNPHACRHRNLNPACLPVPPLAHARQRITPSSRSPRASRQQPAADDAAARGTEGEAGVVIRGGGKGRSIYARFLLGLEPETLSESEESRADARF